MAARKPNWRVNGYDGDYRTRDLLPYASGGHRLGTMAMNEKAAMVIAEVWMKENPPLAPKPSVGDYNARAPYCMVEKVGSGFTSARWSSSPSAPFHWVKG